MAQSSKIRQPGLLVYFCGIGTTLLVLWLVEIANNHDENIMGWYANGIIPAGALLVGIASGIGYAVGARWLNVKLSKAFVLGMITTGLVDYVAAQWVTYMNILERNHIPSGAYSFLTYVRDICEHMSFRRGGSTEAGEPLGMVGYVFKALEMSGFALGTMIPCAILRGQPYCGSCQRYLKQHLDAMLHSPVLSTEIKKLPRKERAVAVDNAAREVCGRTAVLLQKVTPLSLDETLAAFKEVTEAPLKKSTAKVQLRLAKCPECDGHHIRVKLMFIAANGKAGEKALPPLDKTAPKVGAATSAQVPA